MDSPACDANEVSHTTRRDFCTDLMLTATGLVLAAPTVTKVVAAQDSMVAYPPRKIEGAETLFRDRASISTTQQEMTRLCCCVQARANIGRTAEDALTQGVPWNSMLRVDVSNVPAIRGHTMHEWVM